MPYDPNFPQDNALIDALPFRTQFQSLKALIDAVPGGGGGISDVVIDSVTTLPAGSTASVTSVVTSGVLHLQLGLPQGDVGLTGADGAQGPPFANVIIDAVNALPPGSTPTVSASFDGTNVHLTFGLTQGNDGAQGQPGEVSAAQLNAAVSAAVSTTSNNSNAVTTLDTAFSNDPASLADMELMRAKFNELVLALRR